MLKLAVTDGFVFVLKKHFGCQMVISIALLMVMLGDLLAFGEM